MFPERGHQAAGDHCAEKEDRALAVFHARQGYNARRPGQPRYAPAMPALDSPFGDLNKWARRARNGALNGFPDTLSGSRASSTRPRKGDIYHVDCMGSGSFARSYGG
jgi:hypothetical protein